MLYPHVYLYRKSRKKSDEIVSMAKWIMCDVNLYSLGSICAQTLLSVWYNIILLFKIILLLRLELMFVVYIGNTVWSFLNAAVRHADVHTVERTPTRLYTLTWDVVTARRYELVRIFAVYKKMLPSNSRLASGTLLFSLLSWLLYAAHQSF